MRTLIYSPPCKEISMKSRPFCSPASRENRFNITSATRASGSTAYPPRFLSPVAQGIYCNLPTPPEARINLSTKHDAPKALTNLLSDSISEVLTDLVGSRAREAIYDYMERKHSVGRNEIPEHLDSLFTLLEGTFGVGGTKVIGRIIAKKVYAKIDWKFEPLPNLEFADYMERIKTKIVQ
ncbi:MAG: hypothetical protein ABSA50_13130 [Candidatus Bathyarchaeia archaeon]